MAHSGKPDLVLWPKAGKQIWCCGPQQRAMVFFGAVSNNWEPDLVLWPIARTQIWYCGKQLGTRIGAVVHSREPEWDPKEGIIFGAVAPSMAPDLVLWPTERTRFCAVTHSGESGLVSCSTVDNQIWCCSPQQVTNFGAAAPHSG